MKARLIDFEKVRAQRQAAARRRASLADGLAESVDYCRRFGRLPARSRLERLCSRFGEGSGLSAAELNEADVLLRLYSER